MTVLLACLPCSRDVTPENALIMPFDTMAERGRWAAAHGAIHETPEWLVVDDLLSLTEMQVRVALRLRGIAPMAAPPAIADAYLVASGAAETFRVELHRALGLDPAGERLDDIALLARVREAIDPGEGS